MKKLVLGIAAISLLASGPAWAGKFWEDTDFLKWSESDVIKMLTKSPWSRQIDLSVPVSQAAVWGPVPFLTFVLPMTLTMRWLSAAPVREAFARARFGDAAKTSPEALKVLELEPDYYIIGIGGLPRGLLDVSGRSGFPAWMAQMNPPERQRFLFEQMKKETILKIKGRDPIPARDVRFGSDQGEVLNAKTGQSGVELVVFFSKEEITLKDKTVEFITTLMDRRISKKFKLKDMVYHGELEL